MARDRLIASMRLAAMRAARKRAAEAVRRSSMASTPIGSAIPTNTVVNATDTSNSISVKPSVRQRSMNMTVSACAGRRGRRPAVRLLLLAARAVALLGGDGDQRLQLEEALLSDTLDVHQLLDLLAEDSRLTVY